MEEYKEYKTYGHWGNRNFLIYDLKVYRSGEVTGTRYGKPIVIKTTKEGRKLAGSLPIYKLVDYMFRGSLPPGYVIHHINKDKSDDRLENLVRMTRSEHASLHNKDICVSEETRRKLSIAGKGRKHTEETKEKIRKSNLGRIVSKETRKKLSYINIGKTHNETTKRKMSESHKGKPSHRKGKKNVYSAETLRKMSDSLKGLQWYNNGNTVKRFKTDAEAFASGYYNKGRKIIY